MNARQENMKTRAVVVTVKDHNGHTHPLYVCISNNTDNAVKMAKDKWPEINKNMPANFFDLASMETTPVQIFFDEDLW